MMLLGVVESAMVEFDLEKLVYIFEIDCVIDSFM